MNVISRILNGIDCVDREIEENPANSFAKIYTFYIMATAFEQIKINQATLCIPFLHFHSGKCHRDVMRKGFYDFHMHNHRHISNYCSLCSV